MNANLCPFKVGDLVVFRPTLRDYAKLGPKEFYGIEPYDVGKIVKIEEGRFLFLAASKSGLDWEMFEPVEGELHDGQTEG